MQGSKTLLTIVFGFEPVGFITVYKSSNVVSYDTHENLLD